MRFNVCLRKSAFEQGEEIREQKKGRTLVVYGLQDMIWQYFTLQMFLLVPPLLEPL